MLFSKQTPAAGGTAFSQFDAAWAYDGNGYIYNDTGTSLDVRIGASGSVQTLAAGGTLPIKLVYSLAELYVRRTDQSTTQVTVEATVGTGSAGGGGSEADVSTVIRVRGGTYYAADYGQISATSPVSHIAIQAAIDAAYAAGGGTVVLPPNEILLGQAGTYNGVPYAITPRDGVTIKGTMPQALITTGTVWDSGFELVSGTRISFPGGIVFRQDCSASFAEHEPLDGFNLEGLGFKNCRTIVSCGDQSKHGWFGSRMVDIRAENITGCAFDLVNPMHLHLAAKLARAQVGLRMVCNYRTAEVPMSPGNLVIDDLFIHQQSDAQDHNGIEILNAVGSDGGFLGSIQGRKVQVNRFFTTPGGTKTGHNLYLNGNGYALPAIMFLDLDLEGYSDTAIWGRDLARSSFTLNAGPQSSEIRKTIRLENSTDVAIFSVDANTTIEFDNSTTAGRTYLCGKFGSSGDSTNGYGIGVYTVASDSGRTRFQWAPYNGASLIGDQMNLVFGGRLDLAANSGGIKFGTFDYNASGTIWITHHSGTVTASSTSDQSLAMWAANQAPGEETVIYKVGATGVLTLTGIAGGNVTVNNQGASVTVRSVKDPGASSYQWRVASRNGT